MTLAGEIIRLRKEAGSHDKFAALLGTSRVTVIRWEQGAYPSARYRKLLAARGVSPALLATKPKPSAGLTAAEAADLRAAVVALLTVTAVLVAQVEGLGGKVPQAVRKELGQAAARMHPEVRRNSS